MTTAAAAEQQRPGSSALASAWAFVKHHVLTVYALLAFIYLMLPIGIVIAFSFNNPKGRFNYVWSGFTLDNWKNWDGVPGLRSAMVLSLEIALIAPAILAALLLCFAISIDDFVVTYFNSGSEVTFPLYVWGAARIGAPPQVNVIGTAIFSVAVIGMVTNVLVQMRRERSTANA